MTEIQYITGDILTPNTTERGVVVCHQVNCRGLMGAGLAKQVRQMHPAVYTNYKIKCAQIQDGIGGLGDVQFCSCLHKSGYIIANVFGQDGYGRDKRYTDYAALNKALTNIAQTFPHDVIRIPYNMGCGLGGGEWEQDRIKKLAEIKSLLSRIGDELPHGIVCKMHDTLMSWTETERVANS